MRSEGQRWTAAAQQLYLKSEARGRKNVRRVKWVRNHKVEDMRLIKRRRCGDKELLMVEIFGVSVC